MRPTTVLKYPPEIKKVLDDLIIFSKIKASEMLVAPRISECFGLGLL